MVNAEERIAEYIRNYFKATIRECMIICCSFEEQQLLTECLDDMGYVWSSGKSLLDYTGLRYKIGEDDVAAIEYCIDCYSRTVTKSSLDIVPMRDEVTGMWVQDYMDAIDMTELDEMLLTG